MLVDISSKNKHCGNNGLPRLKQTHRIAGVTFIVIDNSLVQQLGIDEQTMFQEELVEDGILLTKHRCSSIALDQKSMEDKPNGDNRASKQR